jgi:hydroxypyruvate reductase
MAAALEDIMGEYVTRGVINVKYGHTARLRKIDINEAGHPVPDMNGERGARAIAGLVRKAGAGDLVINLISGGGSALMPLPADGITLGDKQDTTNLLLASGATIHEINCIRKHLSAIKGGGLARMAYPAGMLTLAVSDVVGDDVSTIASGPSAPDVTTFEDALGILQKYNLTERVPEAVKEYISRGCDKEVRETVKAGDQCLESVANCIVASNGMALEQAAKTARERGYSPLVLTTFLEGEAREAARVIVAVAREIMQSGRPVRSPAALLLGGETTVTIRGDGKGGRNQELALAAALAIDHRSGMVLLSGGTDGTDGPTDAAGAVVDWNTVKTAVEKGIDPLAFFDNNDAYGFFERCGGLIKTGPTGTNVMDMVIVLARHDK